MMKKSNVLTLVILVSLLLIYYLLTDITMLLDPVLFPSLTEILRSFIESLPELMEALVSSTNLLLPAYLTALVSGILLGVIIGLSPTISRALDPLISAAISVPPSTLTPYLIALMPTFYQSSATLLFIAAFWRILTGTISGIRMIDQKYLDASQLMELKGVTYVTKVVLPAAAPSIFSGARSGLIVSFILLPVAEMFAVSSGIGHFIQYYADFADYANVIVGIIFMAIYVVVVMSIFELIRRRVLHWRISQDR